MKMMNMFRIWLVMLLLIASVIPLNVFAMGTTKVGLTPSSTDITIGDTFYVIVWLDGDSDEPTDGIKLEELNWTAGTANIISVVNPPTSAFDWLFDEGTIHNDTGWLEDAESIDNSQSSENFSVFNISFVSTSVGVCYITQNWTKVFTGGPEVSALTTYNTSVTIHPASPVTDISTSSKGLTYINLSWTQSLPSGADRFVLYNESGANELQNSSETYYNHTGLSSGVTENYVLYSYNSSEDLASLTTQTHTETTTTLNSAPSITALPADGNLSVLITTTAVQATITDAEGETFTYAIEGDFLQGGGTSGSGTNATYTANVTTGALKFSSSYTYYVNATDSGSGTSTNESFTFTTEAFSRIGDFNATALNRTAIRLTWLNPTYGDTTLILRKTGSYPTGVGDAGATTVYNGTAATVDDTGLSENTTYYYMGWAYDTTTGNYSGSGAGINESTQPNYLPTVTIHPASTLDNVSIMPTGTYTYADLNLGDTVTGSIYCGVNWTARQYLANISGTGDNGTMTFPTLAYSTTYTIFYNLTDTFGWTNGSYTFATGAKVIETDTLIYENTSGKGYNFITILNETATASGLVAYWVNSSSSEIEYIVQWNNANQEYGDAYYVGGLGAKEQNYTAGDVVLISALQNVSYTTAGYDPTMSWESIALASGYNWLGRTNSSTTAHAVGVALNASGINWTMIITWNATAQQWSSAFLPAYGSGSVYNFNIATGDAILVSVTTADEFYMYGW